MKIRGIKIPKQIKYFLFLSIVLNIIRVFLFGNKSFLYILWNVFLASIPFFISSILILNINTKKDVVRPLFIIGFILWLLFLPNAPYVITDFIHLSRAHLMYDIFFIFASAYTSLLFGLYSILNMERLLILKFSKRIVDIFIVIIIFFTSFGIYLGRFLRFNSWDLFISHDSLFSGIWSIFIQYEGSINAPYL